MTRGRPKNPKSDPGVKPGAHGATTGYEADLWRMDDTLRVSMDTTEYKHFGLGLTFLKHTQRRFKIGAI